jgi:hypothetical protein
MWLNGGLGRASAITLLLLALMIPVVVLYWLVARRTTALPR